MTDNGAIVLRKPDLDDLAQLGDMLISSGFFRDSNKVAQAAVKVLAGRELGLGPVESMRAFHIVEGKVEMSADLLAQRVKAHDKYDYRVASLTNDECSIQFYEFVDGERETLGVSTFSMENAHNAGIVKNGGAWQKYPRNMLFARALSNGVGWFCPDVAGGSRIYVEGEISGEAPQASQASEVDPSTVIDVGGVETRSFAGRAISPPAVTVDTDTGEIYDVVSDVDEPQMLTDGQRRHLFALVRHLGYDEDQRHFAAGVASFNDLTADRASELIDEWTALVDARNDLTISTNGTIQDALGDPRLPNRFWDKVKVDPDTGCWLWQGATRSEYGAYWEGDEKVHRAHKFAYETLVGPVPDGFVLDHLCETPPCVFPAHLEPVTQDTNLKRSEKYNARFDKKAGEAGVHGEDTPASPVDLVGEMGGAPASPVSPTAPELATDPQWEIAMRHFDGNRNKVLAAAAVLLERTVSVNTITRDELTQVVAARLQKKV